MKNDNHIGIIISNKKTLDYISLFFKIKIIKKIMSDIDKSFFFDTYWLRFKNYPITIEAKIVNQKNILPKKNFFHIGISVNDIEKKIKIHKSIISKNDLSSKIKISELKIITRGVFNYFLSINNELLFEIIEKK